MRDTTPEIKCGVRVIDQNGNLLYDNRREPYEDPYVELRGVIDRVFIEYLRIHWPNHRAVEALVLDVERGTVRAETLEDLSREIELTEADAKELRKLGA